MEDFLKAPRFKRHRIVAVGLVTVAALLLLVRSQSGSGARAVVGPLEADETVLGPSTSYDDTYPLRKATKRGRYVIAVISDMDKASAVADASNTWRAVYKEAVLTRGADGTFSVEWTRSVDIRSSLAVGGRGMELSALVVFNGKLYTCDDRTGVVYSLHDDGKDITAIPRYILQEGTGETAKNLKCEWMAVKDGHLFVGGFGKEFVNDKDGSITSEGPMWVKIIDHEGRISHVDWRENFRVLRKATATEHPAYLLHEAIFWHEPHRRWYMLPRRVSKEAYDENKDELRGSNMVLSVEPSFDPASVRVGAVGEIIPTRGFSCFKFVTDNPEEVVALKSVEHNGEAETFISVFNVVTGRMLMPETKFAEVKFEGLEFIEG